MTELKGFFNDYLAKEPLFRDRKSLQTNYTPSKILHRDEQINHVAGILAPCLRMEKPSNLFLYGQTGTGKTLVVRYVMNNISEISREKKLPIEVVYLNCKLKRVADTEYRLIVQLAEEFGKKIPATGLPTDEVYKIFLNHIDQKKKLIILVLDEIDQLVKKAGDEILYNMTRLNTELKNVEFSIIGISNEVTFLDHIDPRVKSSLSEEELIFPPYDALQIQDILRNRSLEAFRGGVISAGVLEKCAAYAAREHGDARRALDLLRVAGELAERIGRYTIELEDIDAAEDKIEKDKVLDIVGTQPKQFQLCLHSILDVCDMVKNNCNLYTGDIYERYKELCIQIKMKSLTQRRISDVIAELDMLGIINAKVISKGRYGRTREISLAVPQAMVPKIKEILREGLGL
ncbi:ORC1-type DNA replication protein [Candidatus Woesearchaeota archaeon]|nr:ORC1-type DNA replication protein [Candidatus Woesearchaeota archaeon]